MAAHLHPVLPAGGLLGTAGRPQSRPAGLIIRAGAVALLAVSMAGCGMEQSPATDNTATDVPVESVVPAAGDAASVAAEASEAAIAAAEASAAAQEAEEARLAEEARVEAERAVEERQRQEAEAAAADAAQAAAEKQAAEQAQAAEAAVAASTWTVTNIVDGDTIDVEQGDTTERIRVLGIDTPEQGECGFEEASSAMGSLVGGKTVLLGVEGRDERDRYDRLIAYVDTTDGVDAGLTLIGDGLAIARYDSRDGYGSHPREQAYVAEDEGSEVGYSCTAPAPVEEPAPAPAAPEPAAELEPAPGAGYQDGPYQNCSAVRAAGAAPIRLIAIQGVVAA